MYFYLSEIDKESYKIIQVKNECFLVPCTSTYNRRCVVVFSSRGVPQSPHKELPRDVSHDLPATAPRLGPLLPAMQRLVQQPWHGSATL